MGIFSSVGNASPPAVCPALPSPVLDAAPIAGNLTFTQLSHWISGIAVLIGGLLTLSLIFMHASHLGRPEEQIKIIRIVAIVPAFGLLSFGSTYLGINAIDLQAWLHVCEAIALGSFFQLVCTYLKPLEDSRGVFGRAPDAELQDMRQPMLNAPTDVQPTGRSQLQAFQYLPVSIILAVATDITQAIGIYCFNSNSIHFAHLWLQIIQVLSVVMCFFAVMRFTIRVKNAIPQQELMFKLFSFKGIIILEVLQTLIFSFAAAHITPTTKLAYTDLTTSIPAILLNVELVFFAVVFWFTFSYRPYVHGRNAKLYYQSGFVAIFKAFNPISLIHDFLRTYY